MLSRAFDTLRFLMVEHRCNDMIVFFCPRDPVLSEEKCLQATGDAKKHLQGLVCQHSILQLTWQELAL